MDNRLLDLVERLTEWRDARPPNCKGRIPAEIWSEAVELAHSKGIAPIRISLRGTVATVLTRTRLPRSLTSPSKP